MSTAHCEVAIQLRGYCGISRINTDTYHQKNLDIRICSGVIIFTSLGLLRSTNFNGRQNARRQAERSPTSGYAQSPTRRGDSPAVPDQRVLRFRRSGSGQVRDVATGTRRAATHNSSGKEFWFFPSFVLSGPTCIRAERTTGIDTTETWASQRTQVNRRGDGVSQSSSQQRLIPESRRLGADGEKRVWCGGTPPQRRAAAFTAKKTPMSPKPRSICGTDELAARYEELRRQVLDRSSGSYRGPGLALLIHRGVKTWMDVSSSCLNAFSPIPQESTWEDVVPPTQRGEIVLVLAAMALCQYPEANR